MDLRKRIESLENVAIGKKYIDFTMNDVNGKFTLRRGFNIKKRSKVLIIEDVITTGKSSMECVKLIKNCYT